MAHIQFRNGRFALADPQDREQRDAILRALAQNNDCALTIAPRFGVSYERLLNHMQRLGISKRQRLAARRREQAASAPPREPISAKDFLALRQLGIPADAIRRHYHVSRRRTLNK